ncbi:unnamed protein product [Polarella glacialis]|uniref:MYND-type domain-containing protein n=1 Tax=Polarella glacialis TaxID=89957 RepID=A0A813JG67_POLGL|nr:unnamed protein product [Polarella glacialis]CAE8674229.1 unnamed protein product [Polarella glacialis]
MRDIPGVVDRVAPYAEWFFLAMNMVVLAIAFVAERRFQLDPNTVWAAELCIVGKFAKLNGAPAQWRPYAVYTFGALLEDLDRLSHEEFQPASRHVKKLMRSMALPDFSRMTKSTLDVSCGYCGEVGKGSCSMSKCLGCEVVRYCGTECQKDHWPVHKKLCKHLKSRRQHSDEAARAALEQFQENQSSS